MIAGLMLAALVGLLVVLPSWLSAPIGWALFVYLLVRAWPAVSRDARALRGGRLPLARGRRQRGRYL